MHRRPFRDHSLNFRHETRSTSAVGALIATLAFIGRRGAARTTTSSSTTGCRSTAVCDYVGCLAVSAGDMRFASSQQVMSCPNTDRDRGMVSSSLVSV